MKKSFVLALSLAAIVISLPACQKTPEEKVTAALTEMTSDKEIQRLNKIGKDGEGAYKKFLDPKKSNSAESKNATKAPDSETK